MEADSLATRLEQLVGRGGDDPVGADLGGLQSELAALRAELDGWSLRLTGAVAASRIETGTVVRRVAELGGDLRRLMTAERQQDAERTAAAQAATGEARASLEARMAVLEDTLDAMAERLEALARDGAHTTRDQLRVLLAAAARIERRLDAMDPSAADLKDAAPNDER